MLPEYYCHLIWTLITLRTPVPCRNKKETHSYIEISESLGVDKPSDILFVTDVFQEAFAAKGAGNKLLIVILKAKTEWCLVL